MRRALAPVLGIVAGLWGAAAPAQITSGFVSIVPCRLMDTRLSTALGYPFPWGTPNFADGEKRLIFTTGAIASGNPCANVIPTFAKALAVNFTVAQVAGAGDLRVAPGDHTGPGALTSSILNYAPVPGAIANATSVDIDALGRLTLQTAVKGAAVIIDVFGYYAREGTSNAAIVAGRNDGTGNGVIGTTAATDSSAAGVWGQGDSGAYGVYGESTTNAGVHGLSTDDFGVSGSSANSDGVHGQGAVNGVSGIVFGSGAGVLGRNQGGSGVGVTGVATGSGGAGVLAQNTSASGVALQVDNGAIKVSGAQPAAFLLTVETICHDAIGHQVAWFSNPYTDNNPNALIFVTPRTDYVAHSDGVGVWYTANAGDMGDCPAGKWFLYSTDQTDVLENGYYMVLVISR